MNLTNIFNTANMVFLDVDAAPLLTKVVDKFGLLLMVGGGIFGIYSLYAYGQSYSEQDPHGKNKAIGMIVGALAIVLSGFLLKNNVTPWINELLS